VQEIDVVDWFLRIAGIDVRCKLLRKEGDAILLSFERPPVVVPGSLCLLSSSDRAIQAIIEIGRPSGTTTERVMADRIECLMLGSLNPPPSFSICGSCHRVVSQSEIVSRTTDFKSLGDLCRGCWETEVARQLRRREDHYPDRDSDDIEAATWDDIVKASEEDYEDSE
jgi:hypothetical protein